MKPASPSLIALLATRQFYSADLYQFDLVGGTTLRYCSGESNITWNGQTWNAGGTTGPYFDRQSNKAKCHWKIGVEVDSLIFDCIPGSATISGETLLSALRQGVFDGATLTLYRAFMPTYGNIADGVVIMFAGLVADVDASRSLATFTVNSHLELLNQSLPRNIYQNSCTNTLYDANCTLVQANYATTGTASSGSTANSVNTGSLAQATGYFDMGILSFTSGVNSGFSRTIKSYVHGSPSTLSLTSPFPSIPATSDAFTVYPGCDKTQATCASKFSNLANFRGFPFIPSPETAV